MDLRRALTVGATAVLTLLAGAGGMAVSAGLLRGAAEGGAGRISPVVTSAPERRSPPAQELDAPPPAGPRVTPTSATPSSSDARHQGEHEHEELEGADEDD